MYKSSKNLADHEVITKKTEMEQSEVSEKKQNAETDTGKKVRLHADESGNIVENIIPENDKNDTDNADEELMLHPKSIKRDILKESQATENPEPVHLTAGQKFFIAMDKFGDFFILNIMLTVFCLPIITIGAAVTALYSVLIKMVKNQEGVAKNDFIKAFKKNFWPATKVWLVLLVIIGALFLQYTYVTNNDTQMASYLMILLGFEMLVVSLIVPFVFPLVARYENTTFNYIKNSFILSIMNIKEWLFAFFHFFLPFLIYYVNPTIFHYSWYLWLVILFCIFGYSKCIVMWKIFDKLEKKPETDKK